MRHRPDSMKRCLVLAAALSLQACAVADTLSGRVVRVIDGDTLVVEAADGQRERIRLAAIDAPDMQVPSKKS